MFTSSEMDVLAADIRAAADESGAKVISAILSTDSDAIPSAAVPTAEFASLIRHVRPRLVYLVADHFDATRELLSSLDVEDNDSFLKRPSIKRLISKWRLHNGETCRLDVAAMCDGVVHEDFEAVDWLTDFENEAETLIDEIAEEQRRKIETEKQSELEPMIKQLMKDPRFLEPKVGVVKKRIALAESLFPHANRDTIKVIVDRAANDHWLTTSG